MTVTTRKGVQLLYGAKEAVALWILERVPDITLWDGKFEAIGVVLGDRIICGVAYHDYQPQFKTIQMTMAADSPVWARKEVIRALLEYPFIELGVNKAWITSDQNNERILKTTDHIGFRREAILKDQFGPGRNAVVGGMYQKYFKRRYLGDKK